MTIASTMIAGDCTFVFESYDGTPQAQKKIAIPVLRRIEPPAKSVRTRKSHHKVRTGCATCKIRRKKCDETKPACLRCTSTGRKCDGYGSLETARDTVSIAVNSDPSAVELFPKEKIWNEGDGEFFSAAITQIPFESDACDLSQDIDDVDEEITSFVVSYEATKLESKSLSEVHAFSAQTKREAYFENGLKSGFDTILYNPDILGAEFPSSDLETQCFSYFQHRTGRQFTAYYDSMVWGNDVVHMAFAHPVLFSVVVAVGAVHRRFELGISREAFEYCEHAARLIAKAAGQLQRLKAQCRRVEGQNKSSNAAGVKVSDLDVIMLSEFLMSIFSAFQGDWDDAVTHTASGLMYLFNRPMRLVHKEERYSLVEPQLSVFERLLDRASTYCDTKFDEPRRRLERHDNGMVADEVPAIFKSLEEARDYVFMELESILDVSKRVWRKKLTLEEAQIWHVERLLAWSAAYAELSKIMHKTGKQISGCLLIKTARNLAYFLLYLTLYQDFDPNPPELSSLDFSRMNEDQVEEALERASAALWAAVAKRDTAKTDLTKQIVVMEDFLKDSSPFRYEKVSVGFDTSVVPPPHKDNNPESSNKTRHLVRFPIETDKVKCSTWQRLGVYGVAEQVGAIEEHALLRVVKACLPRLGSLWVEADVFFEDRQIYLKHCSPNDGGINMKWSLECWTF